MGCCQSATESLPTHGSNRSKNNIIKKGNFVSISRDNIRDKYTIVRTLGQGGFGTVYLVKDIHSGSLYAMKELLKNKMTESECEKLLREVEILRQLDNAHIMRVYEVLENPRSYNIISEYLEGGELFDKIIKMVHFNERLAARYIRELLTALNYLHEQGIVHRDLKPENLVLLNKEEDSPIKLIDFGVSAKITPNSELSEAIGTLFYMAPEVFKHKYNEKCDIWSTGVILYIMLSGKPPFYARDTKKFIQLINKGDVKFPDEDWRNVSSDAKDLIKKMINTNPKKRPSAKKALQNKWITKLTNDKTEVVNSIENISALSFLGQFHAQSKMEKSLLMYISSKMDIREEEKQMIRLFESLDKNGDGRLDKKEIENGFKELGMDSTIDFEAIIKQCDVGEEGSITYSEFIVATRNWKKVVEDNKLEETFKAYDVGGDGKLSLRELKSKIPNLEESEFQQFFSEADSDHDDMITYEEFKNYVLSKISN